MQLEKNVSRKDAKNVTCKVDILDKYLFIGLNDVNSLGFLKICVDFILV